MKEYGMIVSREKDVVRHLNEQGKSGWELVTHAIDGAGDHFLVLVRDKAEAK